jgi:hypothetical protein
MGDVCCACIGADYYDEVEKYAINVTLNSRVASEEPLPMFFGSSYMHLRHPYAGQQRFIAALAFVTRCRAMTKRDYKPRTAAFQKFAYFDAIIRKVARDIKGAVKLHHLTLRERLSILDRLKTTLATATTPLVGSST